MQHRIEYARSQALQASEKATQCTDNRTRREWEKAAQMWRLIAEQYEFLRSIGETADLSKTPKNSK